MPLEVRSASHNMSLYAAFLAFTSGACISIGLAMMEDRIKDVESFKRNFAHRFLGGGLFVVGLYIFSPAVLRDLWIEVRK
jgi:uncharacterized membrane protein YdcZ (DUF606 family)